MINLKIWSLYLKQEKVVSDKDNQDLERQVIKRGYHLEVIWILKTLQEKIQWVRIRLIRHSKGLHLKVLRILEKQENHLIIRLIFVSKIQWCLLLNLEQLQFLIDYLIKTLRQFKQIKLIFKQWSQNWKVCLLTKIVPSL